MKKFLALSMAALMAAMLFAGCQNNLPKITVNTAEDLNGLKIGVQSGTTGEDYVRDNVQDAQLSSFNSGMDAALDLKNGGVDAVLLDELPAKAIVAQNDDLMVVDIGMEKEEYAIAVKKGNTELLNSINATLQRIKEDGTFDNLTAAFMPPEGDDYIVVPEAKATEGEGVLKMGTNAQFKPFEYVNGNEAVGFDISLGQEIAADLGMKFQLEDMKFESLISALDAGSVDFVAAGMTIDAERLESVDFSEPYYSSTQVVIVRK